MLKYNLRLGAILIGFLVLSLEIGLCQETKWVDDDFEDFRKGSLSGSGVDLFVTQSGVIKSINRYDLNHDGFLDIVFNAGHDLTDGVSPTMVSGFPSGQAKIDRNLSIDGSKQVKIADLNNDGHSDAVFLPNDNGVSSRRYLSILWGDENGWANKRKTQLVTLSPIAVDVAELNGDEWPELVVLNGPGQSWSSMEPGEATLRIYWGSDQGYMQNNFEDITVKNALDFAAEDLDGNGVADLVVLKENPGKVQIFQNWFSLPESLLSNPIELDLQTPSVGKLVVATFPSESKPGILITGGDRELIGRDPTTGEEQYRFNGLILLKQDLNDISGWKSPVLINAPFASDLKVADLNRDGFAEVVLADQSAETNGVHVLWGIDGKDWTQHMDFTSLVAPFAGAIDIGDINGDDHLDIAVAVYRSQESYEASSMVFYGDGKGNFIQDTLKIPTDGAIDVVIVPSKASYNKTVLFANSRAGRFFEDIPSKVYWGGSNGFDPKNVSAFDVRSGYSAAAADLNDDGYVDLVLLSIVHAIKEPHPGLGFNILWGGPEGLKNERRTVLNEYGLYDLTIADINKDGYLDLIGSVGYPNNDGDPPGVVIWHGSKEGFLQTNRIKVPTEARPTQHILADFNKDGHLDVALLIGNLHQISIIWGEEEGLTLKGRTSFPFLRGGDMNTADLDGDGWLDLVVSSLLIPNSLFYDFGTYILWGSPNGFDPTNAQKLTGHGTVGITISDWDLDGYTDIFLPSYKYAETRESVAAHLYWGGKDGFLDSLRTDFLQNSGHGAMAGDFNGDGNPDLVVANHRINGSHYTHSQVFYQKGNRFSELKEQLLPSIGAEFIYSDDVGAQYDRTFRKQYESSIFSWGHSALDGEINILASQPGESEVQVGIKTAQTIANLAKAQWMDIDNEKGLVFKLDENDRHLQYRLTFISKNGDQYPEVDKVEILISSK